MKTLSVLVTGTLLLNSLMPTVAYARRNKRSVRANPTVVVQDIDLEVDDDSSEDNEDAQKRRKRRYSPLLCTDATVRRSKWLQWAKKH